MAQSIILSIVDTDQRAVEAKAREVGADILQQYRHLATRLRQQAWLEFAEIGAARDATERASRRCAFQLYTTAASEIDEVMADLHANPDHAGRRAAPLPPLRIAYDVREEELRGGRPT